MALKVVGSNLITHPNKKKRLVNQTSLFFLNDVCLWQMMTALPNDVRFANDVCLKAHYGKHCFIATLSGATSYLQSKCIISPQAMHHFMIYEAFLFYQLHINGANNLIRLLMSLPMRPSFDSASVILCDTERVERKSSRISSATEDLYIHTASSK